MLLIISLRSLSAPPSGPQASGRGLEWACRPVPTLELVDVGSVSPTTPAWESDESGQAASIGLCPVPSRGSGLLLEVWRVGEVGWLCSRVSAPDHTVVLVLGRCGFTHVLAGIHATSFL